MPARTLFAFADGPQPFFDALPSSVQNKIAFSPSAGCPWIWAGAVGEKGYGQVVIAQRKYAVHRLVYRVYFGVWPEEDTDHLCRNHGCVYPYHLEAVTGIVNRQRGLRPINHRFQRDVCAHEHPYDTANTYWTQAGARACRECRRQGQRERRARVAGN